MKQYIFTALLCGLTLCAQAQRISRHYQNESLSKVLEDLNAATSDKTIYFIYDELEDFTVTSHFNDLPIKEAIREVIGFYPMKVTYDDDKIFIECTQKENTKVWNTTSSVEKYRTKNICMNGITMKNCGMGIYCQNLSDLSITDWIFDDMAISPGGYHMFYGSTALKNINLINLAFNGNQYSDDVILVESADQETGASGDSNIIVENITAECSHFASTEPNTLMVIKNGIIAMHNHYSEDMYSGNSSVVMTYYASNNAPNVVFENCIIYHVDGTDKPLIAMSEMNVNLQFINCDIRLNIGAYSVHNVMFHNCKMTGRRLVNTSLNTNFATNVTFKDCDVVAQGYSVLFNTTGKLILDNCRFKTNHTRVIHSTAQAGSIFAYNNIADSSSGSCVFGLDSTYLTDYRDLNNTVYTNSQ